MPKRKSFFKDNTSYNETGAKLAFKMDDILNPIYQKYSKEGYNTREITHIILSSVLLADSKHSIEFSEKFDKEMRFENAEKHRKQLEEIG